MEVTQQDTPPLGIGIDDRMPALMGLTTWKSYHEGRPVRLKEVNGKQELGGV